MKSTYTRCVMLSAVVALVLAVAVPAIADSGSYLTSVQKVGASGQRYTWSPGGC